MNNDTLRYATTIGFGLISIAIALLASLATPIILLDKVVVGALLVGGLGAGGVALNLTPTSVKLAREANANAPIAYAPTRPALRTDWPDVTPRDPSMASAKAGASGNTGGAGGPTF